MNPVLWTVGVLVAGEDPGRLRFELVFTCPDGNDVWFSGGVHQATPPVGRRIQAA